MTTGPLEVLCTLGLAGAMAELRPRLEQAAGLPLSIRFGPAAELSLDIERGAAFDVAVLTDAVIDAQTTNGHIVVGSRVDIAGSCVGATVPPGADIPDISTVEAFRRTVLAAEFVIFTTRGASGQHFASLLPRLGIEEEVRRKAVIGEGLIATRVVTGEIELGIQQVSEILAVPGAVLVGPIPTELQKYTVFSAGLGSNAKDTAAANALIALLTRPSTIDLLIAKGMERV